MSSNTVDQSKNVSLKKMEQSGQRKSVTDQDKKLNPNANTVKYKEIIIPSSTEHLIMITLCYPFTF